MNDCPLCNHSSGLFSQDKSRPYYHCPSCDLIFVPEQHHLSSINEKHEYDFHQNNPTDLNYRQFLNQVIEPLESYIRPGMSGLDFGSGPGPTLHLMLQEKGLSMQNYDPFYAPDAKHLEKQYDLVTCTEVVEHFNHPNQSWKLLVSLVKTGGLLAIMTLLIDSQIKKTFSTWWYKNNKTHIAFYSLQTLKWIANCFKLELIYVDNRVALFRKEH